MQLSTDPTIIFLSTYPRELKIYTHTKSQTQMYITAFLVTAKDSKHLKQPIIREWLEKLVHPHCEKRLSCDLTVFLISYIFCIFFKPDLFQALYSSLHWDKFTSGISQYLPLEAPFRYTGKIQNHMYDKLNCSNLCVLFSALVQEQFSCIILQLVHFTCLVSLTLINRQRT